MGMGADDHAPRTTRQSLSTQLESWLREAARLPAPSSDTPPPAPLAPGDHLCHGRFIVGQPIGRGGMGAVFEAHDAERRADIALKTLVDARPQRLLALKHEFRELQDLHHPNLVDLGELFEDEGRWFFTMERVRGVPFTAYVRPDALDEARLRSSLIQLAEGLRVLHRAGKVHRDVKPSNTLVEPGGRLVLLDFGLIADAHVAPDAARAIAGTAAYMAPEQAVGEEGSPADWYAVGAMMYEALTGTLPFDGDAHEVLARKAVELPEAPSARAGRPLPRDLEALCMELLRIEADRRPSGAQLLLRLRAEAGRTSRPPEPAADDAPIPFVGRAQERAVLEEAFARSCGRGPVAVLVRGESGIGKSALVGWLGRELAGRAMVFTGRCYEREFVPYKALDGVVDALARRLDALDAEELVPLLPGHLAALARVFPVLSPLLGRVPEAARTERAPDPHELRRRAFVALRELLCRLAEREAVVIVIDDVQWADADSMAALGDLLRGPEAPPLLVVLTGRPGTAPPPIDPAPCLLDLLPLCAGDATELARRLLASAAGHRAAEAERLAEEAGRHPLFIEALARHAADGSAPVAGEAVDLRQALASRVSALEPTARAMVELVSVAVQPLSPATLAHAAGAEPETVARSVRGLQAERLASTRREGFDAWIEPYHDHVRRAVVDPMSAQRLAACHRRLAEALEATAPDKAESLAVHWHGSGDDAKAYAHAVRAADRARQALAFDRAASLYRWALELEPAAPAGVRAAGLRRRHAEALANAGRGAEAAVAYRSAAGCAGSPAERWDLERCAAEQLLRAGHTDEGLTLVDSLLPELGMARPRHVPAALVGLLREKVAGELESGLRGLVPRGARDGAGLHRRMDACWAVAVGLAQVDPLASAVFQGRYLRLAERSGDGDRIALGLCLQAPAAASSGPPAERARRMLDRARALAGERAEPRIEAHLALAEGSVSFLLGHWTDALHHSERALRLLRDHCAGASWETATAHRFALTCLWHTGRVRELSERAYDVFREAEERGDRYAATQLRTTVLPIVHLLADDPGAATDCLSHAVSDWSRQGTSLQHWQHMQSRALVDLYTGRPLEALHRMDARMPEIVRALLFRIQAIRLFTRFLRASAAVGAAARAVAEGRGSGPLLRRAERDGRRLEREKVAPESAAMVRAQVAWVHGDRAAAEAELVRAEAGFAERGMDLMRAVAASCRGRAAGSTRGAATEAEAKAWMKRQGVQSPAGFIRLLAPAFGTPRP